jgi:5-methylcytosine-specific restriction endonuclease McrBC regulatory subunit McrC
LITSDYSIANITPDELDDLRVISDMEISNISLEDYPNLLVFPDSFSSYDRDLGKKVICSIADEGRKLCTNSMVGFIGRNNTHLSIHSRFADNGKEDFFLHYMLQKVAKINLFNLQHTMDEDCVFDFLLYLFPLYLKNAISQGVYRQYITHKYNDANVRGVIDVSRHIKYNEPFNGAVAYTTREYSYDNHITQLIRHTIEFISKNGGDDILNIDEDTKQAVAQIIGATPSYLSNELQSIINKNLTPIAHPYYSEFAPLQRLCLQILRHEELKYGQEEDEVYGVLIDAAWLWEEYLAIILEGRYNHYLKDSGKRFYLFENFQQIIPDYLSIDKKIVADAKYIPLNRESWYGEEKATSINYKTITYMYRFCSNQGFLFYPYPDEDVKPTPLKIKTEISGVNGGTITKLGLRIPLNCDGYTSFCISMGNHEQDFIKQCDLLDL